MSMIANLIIFLLALKSINILILMLYSQNNRNITIFFILSFISYIIYKINKDKIYPCIKLSNIKYFNVCKM